MDYKELQAKAKELGLKYVGVSEKELKKSIKETKVAEPELPPIEENIDPPLEPDADAVVYNGKHKVRTYTIEQHGKNYIKLAEQYVSHPDREGYEIKFETVETRLTCPHCGKKFRYN